MKGRPAAAPILAGAPVNWLNFFELMSASKITPGRASKVTVCLFLACFRSPSGWRPNRAGRTPHCTVDGIPLGTAIGAFAGARFTCYATPMSIERDSIHFKILEKLCSAPRPVRGVSTVMLNRAFDAIGAIETLAEAGLIEERGWDVGPGAVWIPTEAGECLYDELVGAG